MLQQLYFYCVAKYCANFQSYQESISEINLAKLKTAFRENLCWLCFLAQHAVPNKIASQLYIFSQLKHAMTFNQRTLRKPEVVSPEVYSNTFKCPTACPKRDDKKIIKYDCNKSCYKQTKRFTASLLNFDLLLHNTNVWRWYLASVLAPTVTCNIWCVHCN